MIKYLFIFLLLLLGFEKSFSQSTTDSVENTELNDSLEIESDEALAAAGYVYSDTLRQVPANQVRSYVLNPDYAYANDPEYWQKEKPANPGTSDQPFISPGLKWILLTGMSLLVLFGIYLLARENNFSWLTRKRSGKMAESPDDSPVGKMDYDGNIKKYHAEGDYRLAVRYMYLRLIHELREKKGFQFRDSATNTDISRAFKGPGLVEFSFLAGAYEYIFYGGFVPGQELYETIKNRFDSFQQFIKT